MLYSSAGLLALIIQLIINHDVLWGRSENRIIPAHRAYRAFLISISFYYVTDILWGLLYEHRLITLTHIDTAFYFIAMAFSILYWTQYVIRYLKEENAFGRILTVTGRFLFIFQIVMLPINFFFPILYTFDDAGVYHALYGRYATLAIQIIMFLWTAIYAFFISRQNTGAMRLRHRTVGLSSVTMALSIIAQACFPLLPLYAIGCLLSTCLLHTFVMENEKEEYRDRLEVQLQESILKGNYYDLLTGLPGMSYFFDRAQRKREALTRRGSTPAFLYLNLSGLKFYNRSHGFSEGDRLLRDLAQRLSDRFGSDSCSRLGQDHFAAFTEEAGLTEALDTLFREWTDAGQRPAILVGVYLDRDNTIDISATCDMAKIACDAIHSTHTCSVAYYDNAMFISAEKAQYITSHLDQAIAERWIQVYYQPIVRGTNGRVCDEEALARWIDPERGFLSPADFIPILEDSNLIYKLDLYVVDQVIEKLKRQQQAGLYLVPQSINLSRSDFNTCDIVDEITRRVDAAGFERRLFTIEITESILGADFDFMKGQVDRFRGLGFPVWMDDFGSGYSSLDVLQSMQVDLIKFDMRFMQQFTHEEKNRVILTELMKMAIGLGIDTVCEGVERADQVTFLQEIGCSKLQGYYFAKPMPLSTILERYERGTQIGFENPDESDYFDTVGRINLYDLSVIVKDEKDSFNHYFSTVPMAIVEVRGSQLRLTRSNQAYRDYLKQSSGLKQDFRDFRDMNDIADRSFINAFRQCRQNGDRVMFDNALPDGAVAHSLLRRIAEDPVTGTQAVVIAVLTITDPRTTPQPRNQKEESGQDAFC